MNQYDIILDASELNLCERTSCKTHKEKRRSQANNSALTHQQYSSRQTLKNGPRVGIKREVLLVGHDRGPNLY